MVFNSCDVVPIDFEPLWEFATGPLIELDAEHRQFKALNGQYRGRVTFTCSSWFANGVAYGVNGFVGKIA